DASARTIPLILIYYKPYDGFKVPPKFQTIAGNECETTFDRSKLAESSGVVLYYSGVLTEGAPAATTRTRDQMYTYFGLEPTWAIQGMDYSVGENHFFNWTMSYKRTSSIYFPYGSIDRLFGDGDQSGNYGADVVQKLLSRKRNDVSAVWFVSNCGNGPGPVLRKKFAESLEFHGLKLDKLGGCYGNYAPNRFGPQFSDLISKYKFYLSFENGFHCHDYITEKLWVNAYSSGAVPIVWGAPKADVKAVAPTNSFIHVDDFKNAKELAEYLILLSSNDTAYAQYFQWRVEATHDATTRKDYDFYQMCNMLWGMRYNRSYVSTIPSIKDWFIGEETPECLAPNEHGVGDMV
uniref:Fucosyltransferase n=1 Tax=Ciona savignyi TaxID=51511 RepID=H2YWB4_CIOSA